MEISKTEIFGYFGKYFNALKKQKLSKGASIYVSGSLLAPNKEEKRKYMRCWGCLTQQSRNVVSKQCCEHCKHCKHYQQCQ